MLHSSLCMFRITAGLQTVMSPFWRWRHRTHTRLRPLWTGWWRCNVHPSDCPCDSPWRTVRTSCSTTEKTESGTQDVFKHEEDHSKLLPLASRCNTPGTSTERLDLTCDIVLMSKSNRLRSRIKTRGGFTIRHSWVTQDALSQRKTNRLSSCLIPPWNRCLKTHAGRLCFLPTVVTVHHVAFIEGFCPEGHFKAHFLQRKRKRNPNAMNS